MVFRRSIAPADLLEIYDGCRVLLINFRKYQITWTETSFHKLCNLQLQKELESKVKYFFRVCCFSSSWVGAVVLRIDHRHELGIPKVQKFQTRNLNFSSNHVLSTSRYQDGRNCKWSGLKALKFKHVYNSFKDHRKIFKIKLYFHIKVINSNDPNKEKWKCNQNM